MAATTGAAAGGAVQPRENAWQSSEAAKEGGRPRAEGEGAGDCSMNAGSPDAVSPTLGEEHEKEKLQMVKALVTRGATAPISVPAPVKEADLSSSHTVLQPLSHKLSSSTTCMPKPAINATCVVDISHMQPSPATCCGHDNPQTAHDDDDKYSYVASKLTAPSPYNTKVLTVELIPQDDEKLKVLHLSPHDIGRGKSTFFQATLNCVSLLYGLGILSSPYAIARAGWMGAVISVMISTSYAYTAHLMARCVEFDPSCSNYQDIAKLVFGKRMRKLITALFYMELTGTLVGYCISMGDNLNYIFPHVAFSVPGLSNRNLMICIVTLIILPSVWLRDLSSLSFTSIWCIASSVLLLVAVMLAATVNHIGFTYSIPFLRIKGVPVAAGLYAFSYGGTSVFPSIYKSMKDPSRFTQVLAVSFFIATASIAGLGVAGAYMFGEHTASQVTLSMPIRFVTTKIVLWTTILTPVFKFALQLSPITTAVEAQLYRRCANAHTNNGTMSKTVLFAISTLMRSSVLAIIAIISMILPYFEYIIALVGSSMTIAICMIFPCLFYLKLYWKRLPSLTIALITVLIGLGIVVGACGTVISFQGLVQSRTSHHQLH